MIMAFYAEGLPNTQGSRAIHSRKLFNLRGGWVVVENYVGKEDGYEPMT